jgi:hypothetical protein
VNMNNKNFPIPFKKVFNRIKFGKEDVENFLSKLSHRVVCQAKTFFIKLKKV